MKLPSLSFHNPSLSTFALPNHCIFLSYNSSTFVYMCISNSHEAMASCLRVSLSLVWWGRRSQDPAGLVSSWLIRHLIPRVLPTRLATTTSETSTARSSDEYLIGYVVWLVLLCWSGRSVWQTTSRRDNGIDCSVAEAQGIIYDIGEKGFATTAVLITSHIGTELKGRQKNQAEVDVWCNYPLEYSLPSIPRPPNH